MLLGDPGSGKSSLARYVVLELLRPNADNQMRPWRRALDGYVPFLVEVRDLVTRDAPGHPCSIPTHIADLGSRLGFGFPAEAVERELRTGRSLLIVDGLDEIFDPGRRRDLVEEVIGLETHYPDIRVLVTSRVAGFEALPFERAGFTIATLDDLSSEQIMGFSQTWFSLVFPEDEIAAAICREDLLDAVKRRPQLKTLAGNPLMLTVMATVARHKRLGRSRIDIYRQALELLCYGWDYRRGLKLAADSPLINLDPSDTLKMLRRIAWRMQEGGGVRANAVKQADLKAELIAFFDADWRFNPPKSVRAASDMIRLLAERNWIIAPRGPGLFGFVHRTFLEYLCAYELNERFRSQSLSLNDLRDQYVHPYVLDDSWHEVIRLLVGQLPAAGAGAIIQTICPQPIFAAKMSSQLVLAWQCISEIEPTDLREISETCELITTALYYWLGEIQYCKGEDESIRVSLNTIAPGSWPVPCLSRWGLPSPSPEWPYSYEELVPALAGAIWRHEPGSYRILTEAIRKDQSDRRRVGALLSIAAHWTTATQTKPLLLARAVEDPENEPRAATLRALAQYFGEAAETKPLLLARAVQDPGEIPREAALRALARHFQEATETKQLLLMRAVADQNFGPRAAALRSLAQHFRDAAETKPLLLARAIDDLDSGPRRAALSALAEHFREAAETKPLLLARAVKDPDGGPRGTALSALAERFPEAVETKPLLLERAVNDPDSGPRESALRALAQHFQEAVETKPLLLARIVADQESGSRTAALQALARYFREASETKSLLLARAVDDPDSEPRGTALWILAEHFRDAAETKPILLARAVADPGESTRGAALWSLAQHFWEAEETKPLLLKRAVKDPAEEPRCTALWGLATHFREAPETKPLLLARAVEDPDSGPRGTALSALAERFREAAETKPLLLARAVEEQGDVPSGAALQALARHYREAAETKPLLDDIAARGDSIRSGYAMMLLAQLEGDGEGAILLSQELDASWPCIDPNITVDEERLEKIAEK